MTKRRAKFKVGDIVRVDTPLLVVRVGYPLCLADFRHEADLLIQRLQPEIGTLTERERKKLRDTLAGVLLRRKDYGGDVRSIHTSYHSAWWKAEATVERIRYAKTGVYMPANLPGYWDNEYDPPYLGDVKTHRILSLRSFEHGWLDVEDCHVTFLRSKEEAEAETVLASLAAAGRNIAAT